MTRSAEATTGACLRMGLGMSNKGQDDINQALKGKGGIAFTIAAGVLVLAFIIYGFIL